MSHMFNRKSKKLPKPFQKHIVLGIPTNIAVGPLGFRAELDIDPTGNQNRSDHDSVADRPDSSIAMLDENNPGPSRIVFHNKSEDQGLHVPETSTPGVVVDGIEHGDDRTSGSFRRSSSSLYFSFSEENADETKEEEGGPAEAIRGTYQCRCAVRFLLTSTSSGERPGGYGTWCYPHSCKCRRGSPRRIWTSPSVASSYLRRLYKRPSSPSTPLLKIVLD